MRFDRHNVIITGSGSGIGAVTASRFAEEGATVVIADIDEDAAEATAGAIPRARARRVDVADRGQVLAFVERVQRELGHVDVLINNAATCSDAAFEDIPEEEWIRDIDVSLKAAFLLSQAVLPGMRARRRGVILNVASVNGITYLGNEAYSAAKAGLLSLTRSLAVRYGPEGIRVNALVPGTIATPIWNDRLAVDPTILDRSARWYPLGRVGTPNDVASAALFLASHEASWITGVALPVDGGLLAGNAEMAREIVIGDSPGQGPPQRTPRGRN